LPNNVSYQAALTPRSRQLMFAKIVAMAMSGLHAMCANYARRRATRREPFEAADASFAVVANTSLE
jgi:hypothetical protein